MFACCNLDLEYISGHCTISSYLVREIIAKCLVKDIVLLNTGLL